MISQFIDEDVFRYVEDFSFERENFKDLVCYAEENRVPIVSQDVARFLEFLLKTIKPKNCLLYTSPSPRDLSTSRMPSSA